MKRYLFLLVIIVTVYACKKDNDSAAYVSFYVPEGFPPPVYTFNDNEISKSGFELGRKLFYDPVLSKDSTVSCGSCHQQFVAFAHSDHRLSHGIHGLFGTRNAPALFNIAWQNSFFWDGGSNSIEVQPIAPIENPVEMDESLANVIVKLQNSKVYPGLFRSAFGSDSIVSRDMLRALTQFMAAMISDNSKYDRYKKGQETFSQDELNGLQLFRQHCETCHTEPLFTDLKFRNNGLDAKSDKDPGRAMITLSPLDSGKFKVPSLRNIALTKPYMHDGRFDDLSEVLDHYSSGIKQSTTLDPLLTNGIVLTTQQKNELLAFLNTLTDEKFVHDKRFSEQ